MSPPNTVPSGRAPPRRAAPFGAEGPPRPPRAPRALAALRWALFALAVAALFALWAFAPQFFQPSRRRGGPAGGAPVDAQGANGQ